jgi:hypothetical protein
MAPMGNKDAWAAREDAHNNKQKTMLINNLGRIWLYLPLPSPRRSLYNWLWNVILIVA